ncbi:MAG: flagellar filament capping protein FliD [Lachnospiraceae bacterium]|uniref:flagellar filament capping protein FliD n=1 Tax=Candidatus Merdisoma sp. JLR.KK006 TaxID=3112626 RepID=UPI002FEFBF93|nr:flagellar filament capping protein FliD [Lachnospiraceae bacterium]
MSVGRISSSMVSYMNYTSSINQLRLQQALQNYHSNRQAVSPVQRVNSSYKDSSLDFLKSYNTTMSDLMQSANTLRESNSSGAANALKLGSSDETVAIAEERFGGVRSGQELTLDITQVAKAQMNESKGVNALEKASSGMDFSIRSESASGGVSYASVKVDARKSNGSLRTNQEMLEEAASQINRAKSGVEASVEVKDGKASLRITGKNTGEGNTFQVNGNTGIAEGLSDTVQAAQNANYSVTQNGVSRNYVSSANEVSLDMGRVKASLMSEGKAVISAQQDNEKIASAVSDLVKSYNKAVEFLGSNTGKGSAVNMQLRNMVRSLGSEQSLEKAGITMNKDGTLSFDKETLAANMKKEPNLVRDVISGRNGIAQAAFDRGSAAMRTNSAQLVQNMRQTEESWAADSYQFMNTFSKSGAYNLSNYMALGLMMDYFV